MVLWHVEQFAAAKGAPADTCVGLFVCCQVVKWHPEFPQSVGAIVSEQLMTMLNYAHASTSSPFASNKCAFVSGKPVVAWSKVDVQVFVLWHVEHGEVEKPAAM